MLVPSRPALRIRWLVAALLALACSPSAQPPNLLLYVVDTLRADSLGVYGHPFVHTPHLDQLAREGVLVEQAFASSSWTRTSMATLFTGLHPAGHGAFGRYDPLPADAETLATRLAARGYATAFATANPNAGSFFGFGRGFDEMADLFGRGAVGTVENTELVTPSQQVTGWALEWLETAPSPFFLALLTVDPHAPYAPPRRFDRYAGPDSLALDARLAARRPAALDAAGRQRLRSLYLGEVAANDASFGALLEGLRAKGILDDTVVVFTSDHGEEFWEYGRTGHGKSLSDVVTRVPLVLRYPAALPAGARIERPVQLVDLAPTLLTLLGLDPPDDLDGRDLFAEPAVPTRVVMSLALDGVRLRALREPPWKLVEDLESGSQVLYDLRLPEGDRRPAPQAPAGVRERLGATLASVPVPVPERDSPRELPIEVEDALRALGYVEDEP